ncbi:TPA: hypothetical protein ACH3X1_007988 [Trebouxia sp. C0004]
MRYWTYAATTDSQDHMSMVLPVAALQLSVGLKVAQPMSDQQAIAAEYPLISEREVAAHCLCQQHLFVLLHCQVHYMEQLCMQELWPQDYHSSAVRTLSLPFAEPNVASLTANWQQ